MNRVTRERIYEIDEACEEGGTLGPQEWRDLHIICIRLLALEDALRDAGPALDAGARGCEMIKYYRADLIGGLSPSLLKQKAGDEFEYTDHAATLRMLAALGGGK